MYQQFQRTSCVCARASTLLTHYSQFHHVKHSYCTAHASAPPPWTVQRSFFSKQLLTNEQTLAEATLFPARRCRHKKGPSHLLLLRRWRDQSLTFQRLGTECARRQHTRACCHVVQDSRSTSVWTNSFNFNLTAKSLCFVRHPGDVCFCRCECEFAYSPPPTTTSCCTRWRNLFPTVMSIISTGVQLGFRSSGLASSWSRLRDCSSRP